jgi:WD40 repeat protein
MPPLDGSNGPTVGPIQELTVADPIRLYWSGDSSRLAIQTPTALVVYDLASGLQIQTLPLTDEQPLLSVAGGPLLAAVRSGENRILLLNLADLSTVREIEPDPAFGNLANLSNDGRWLVTDSFEQIAATVWDVNTGEKVATLTGFETAAPIYSVQFGAHNAQVIWVARASVQLQSVETGELRPKVSHEDFVSAVALSPDGTRLATTAGGTINGELAPLALVWDAASGQPLWTAKLDKFGTALAFSSDGTVLAVGDGSTIRLFDAASGSPIRSLEGHTDTISSLAYAPDGSRLASAGFDGWVLIWSTDLPQY